MENFVGILQEVCQKLSRDTPTYSDVYPTQDENSPVKWFSCLLDEKETKGSGRNKKIAKQKAAEQMLELVKNDSSFSSTVGKMLESVKNDSSSAKEKLSSDGIGVKINVFANKKGKESLLISGKGKEGDLYVVECQFDGHTEVGKGSSKKTAKKNALEKIANHFEVHTYFDNLKIEEETLQNQKPILQQLYELVTARKLNRPTFPEERIKVGRGNSFNFIVCCKVNNLLTKSNLNISLKQAKIEAASLMLVKIKETPNFNTPN